MRTIRTAVVGAGRWGRNIVRDLHTIPGSELVAVCDRSADALSAVSATYPGVKTCTDLSCIVSDPSIEAVAVAVPVALHHAVARELILAGKSVFLEKPMALNVAHAEELKQLARGREVCLMVGHLMEYHPGINYLRDAVARGEFGRVHYVHSRRVSPGPVRPDETALWGLAVHDVALAYALFGEDPIEVNAEGGAFVQRGIEDVVFLTLRYADGSLFNIHASWLDPTKERRLTVMGTHGAAVFDDMLPTGKVRLFREGASALAHHPQLRDGELDERVRVPVIPADPPLRLEIEHFLDSVRNEREPRTNGTRGVEVVRTLAAAEESMRSGGRRVALRSAA